MFINITHRIYVMFKTTVIFEFHFHEIGRIQFVEIIEKATRMRSI